jgi:hypothetical protein
MKTITWRPCNRWYFRARSQIVLKHVPANRHRFAFVYLYPQTEFSDSHVRGWSVSVSWDDWCWSSGETCCLHLQANLFIYPETPFSSSFLPSLCVPSFSLHCVCHLFYLAASTEIPVFIFFVFSFTSLLKILWNTYFFFFQTFHIHIILLRNNLPYKILISNSLLFRFLSYLSLPIYITKQH